MDGKERKEYAHQVASAFARMAATKDGKVIFNHLREEYKDVLLGRTGDPFRAGIEIGQHNIVVYIENLIEAGKHGTK